MLIFLNTQGLVGIIQRKITFYNELRRGKCEYIPEERLSLALDMALELLTLGATLLYTASELCTSPGGSSRVQCGGFES